MRKLLFFATTVAVLASSCQNVEILNEVKTPMGFQAGIGKQTKALAESGEAQLESQGFKLWAYNTGAEGIYSGISDVKVSYDSQKWAAASTYYWPGKGNQLDFYAISQDETNGQGAGTIEITRATKDDASANNIMVKGFTIPTNADNDLMVAAKITQSEDEGDKGGTEIRPVFGHVLTKVAFNFNQDETSFTDGAEIIVNSISTTADLLIDGDYNVSEVDNTAGWTNTTPSYNSFSKNDALTLKNEKQNYVTWLLMPQALTNGDGKQEVTINYTVNGVANTKKFNLFQTGKIETWAINQFVSYNIMISPKAISFNPSVTDWTTEPSIDLEIK